MEKIDLEILKEFMNVYNDMRKKYSEILKDYEKEISRSMDQRTEIANLKILLKKVMTKSHF